MSRTSTALSTAAGLMLFAAWLPAATPDAAGVPGYAANDAARPTKGQGDAAAPWKLSTAVGPAYALGKAAGDWARRAAAAGDGAVAVKVFPGAVLARGDPTREPFALRDGEADLAVGSTLLWSVQFPELTAIALPWLAPDPENVEALVAGAVRERLDAAIERHGCVPLAYAALPPRALATTARVVRTPEDVRGLSVRIAPLPYLVDLFAALGAGAQTGSPAEAQEAFRAGTLDAQEGTLPMFAAARLDALGIRHVTLWGAVAEVAVFAASRSAWDRASAPQQARLRAAAADAAAELAAMARAEHETALAELQRRGVAITRLTPAGQRAFAAAAQGVYERWAATAGIDLVREAEAAVRDSARR